MTTATADTKKKKARRKKERREKLDNWLTESSSPRIRAIKAFLFPRAKLRVVMRDNDILTERDAEIFLRDMGKPVVYNEYLTAAMEEHDRQVTSKWSKKN